LNRFKKFILNTDDMIKEKFRTLPSPIPLVLKAIKYGVEDFVKWIHPSTTYGYVKEETINSLLLSIIETTVRSGSPTPVILPSFTVGSTAAMPDPEEVREEPYFDYSNDLSGI